MRILILGNGKMGSFFSDLLSFNHEIAVFEKDLKRMRFIYNALRFSTMDQVKEFAPELVINCPLVPRLLRQMMFWFHVAPVLIYGQKMTLHYVCHVRTNFL